MVSNKRLLVRCKRVLAWLLAVTMVTGTLPASVVQAAELPAAEQTDVSVSDVPAAASDDVVVDDVESTVPSDDTAAEDPADDVTDGDLAAETMSTETMAAETQPSAAGKAGESAPLVPVIKVDTDRLSVLVENSGVDYNYITDKAEANYQKTNPVYGDVLAASIKGAVSVELGATTSDYLKSKLTYAWKKADGSAVSEPDTVGEYKLVASLAAQENYCAAAVDTEVFTLKVKQAEIEIRVQNAFRPGDTAQYVIDQNAGATFWLNGAEVAKDEYVSAISFEVYKAYPSAEGAEGYTYTKLAPADVLQGKEDYRLEAVVALKDTANYKVKEDKFNIKLGAQIPTWIEIDGAAKGKVYDTTPLAGYGTAEAPADFTIAGEKGFTAKVFYRDEKTGEKKEVPGKEAGKPAEIKGTWYIDSAELGDADHLQKVEDEKFVPVDAGVYYYVLTYEDENGTYANASDDEENSKIVNKRNGLRVRVEIKPVQIVVVPEITVDADHPIYTGATVASVLSRVVYSVTGTELKPQDDKYFWGSAYSTDDREQYYVPVFQIERGLKDASGNVATWANYTGEIVLEETVTEKDANGNDQEKKLQYGYRVVFSGYKAIFDENGNATGTVDINFSQKNYTVDTTAVTKENNAKVFIPTASTEAVISVDPILKLHDGKGATIENAFVKEYDGEEFYQDRGVYKVATVTPSEAASSLSLVYRWEVANIYESLRATDDETEDDILKVDKDGKLIYERLDWTDYGSYNNAVENYAVPYQPGIYRLKVSLNPSVRGYHAEDAYVYYVIQPQNTLVELKGNVSVYADGITTAGDLLESLQTKNPEQTDTYVELKVYPVTVSDAGVPTKVGAEGDAAEGGAAEAVSSPIEKLIKYYFEENDKVYDEYGEEQPSLRSQYFRVEKEAANVGWVKCADNEILENGVKYRVIFNSEAYNQADRREIDTYIDADKKETKYILYDNRYNYGGIKSRSYQAAVGDTARDVYVSDFYNFGQKIDTINHIVSFKFYENVAVAVEAKQSAATEVEISVDETKLTGNVKTYDGKPFDLTSLQNLIKVTKTADGSDVTETVMPMLKIQFVHSLDFWNEFRNDNAYEIWYDLWGKSVDASKAIHADDYYVTISLAANADYKQANLTLDTKYVIERKKVNVTVTPKEEVRAGRQVPYFADQFVADYILKSDNILNCCTFEIDGEPVEVAPAEEGATGIKETEVSEIVGKPYNWHVHRSIDDSTDRYTGYLKSSETYYAIATSFEYGLRQDANYLNGWIDYEIDYEAVCEKVVFTPKRAAASVTEVNVPLKDDVSHNQTLDQFTHTITARASVPFVDGNTQSGDQGAKKGEGNFFEFTLWVPGEFRGDKQFADDTVDGSYKDSIFFKNSIENIEKSGGKVIGTGNSWIDVQYDAAMGGQPTFDVLWAKDYVETYVVSLKDMTLDVDLRKAVAPKSLSFSSPAKTMYVGETQQLDVKIKKNQMGDIILLGYSSDKEDVLRVSEDGFVTALTTGSATIEVFPCVMVNGEKTRIQAEGKTKVKTAKVKINVKQVSKTKVTKIKAGDTYAEVTYNAPADGYRREAYVLAGKVKEAEFEQAIAAVKNGDYSAFVAVDLNISGTEKAVGTKGAKTGGFTINGLKPGKNEYTVYVRNVSGLRELEDGGQVAVSAAGSVKTFKTTAPEIAGLNIHFDSTITVETTEDYGTQYVAQFVNKTTKLEVQAKLWQRYLVDYADGGDYVWRDLPLGASEKKIFMVPKLQYFVSDKAYAVAGDGGYYNPDKGRYTEWSNLSAKVREILVNGGCELYGNMVYYNGYWYNKTSAVAKIDKGGKITFMGVTDLNKPIYVLVTDTVSKEADVEKLIIKASPDSLTAKSAKLQPGQTIWLSDYLEYKQGKAKVLKYADYFMDLSTDTASTDAFKIEYVVDAHDNHTIQGGDYRITALAPGKLDIDVTDGTVGKSAKVKLTCVGMESVKNLKVQAAYDDKFRITFNYPRDDVQFKYELKTASGKVILTEITGSYGEWDAKTKKYVYTVNFGDPAVIGNWVDWMYRSYDARDLGFENTIIDTTMPNRRNRINMLSNYVVTVTALDGDQMSKPVNLKVKTTNVPASYHDIVAENLVKYDKDNRGSAAYDGGENIRVGESGTGLQNTGSFLFKSGNIYTLTMTGSNEDAGSSNYKRYNSVAQRRMSDTLVWKSYNSKVASVKANAGTYSAKLTAVRPGTTVIEVSSKLTKKVIARHTIVVCAVGDAHVYYADNEPYNRYDGEFLVDRPVTDRDILESTLNKAIDITLQPGERQWFVFTAPAIGFYKVSLGNNYEAMEKGATRYFSVANTTSTARTYRVYVTASNDAIYTTEVVLGDNPVSSGQSYYFIAPEDNTYTIEFVDKADPNKKSPNKMVHAYKKGEIWTIGNLWQPTLGKEFILRITKRELSGALSLTTDTTVELNNKDEVKWYSFTAEESNSYTFTITPAEAAIGAKQLKIGYYTNLTQAENVGIHNGEAAEVKSERKIKKGETVYISISSADAAADSIVKSVIKVSKRDAGEAISVGTKDGITFAENGEKWFEFTAPDAGIYLFTATGTKKAKTEGAEEQKASLLMESYTELDSDTPSDGNFTRTGYMKAGDKIYVRLSENSGSDDPDTTVTAKIVIEKVSIDFTGSIQITVPANESKTITWNPKNAGRYNIAMSTTAEKSLAENLTGEYAGYVGFTTTDPIQGRYVTAGDESIEITNDNAVEVTVTVTVSEFTVPKIEIGKDQTIALTANGEQWYKFIPEESNSYVFSFAPNAASKDANYTVDLEFYQGIDSNNRSFAFELGADRERTFTGGATYFIKITPHQILADNVAVGGNLKITKREFTGVLPMSGTSVTLGSSIERRYEFTAPEHGFYTFSAEGSKVLAAGADPVAANVRLRTFDNLTDNSDHPENPTGYSNKVSLPTVELDAGQHYILAVSSNEATAAQAVTAKISVRKETMFSIGNINITVPKAAEDGTAGSALVYWFPRSTWRYNITMSTSAENADTDLDATVYGEDNSYYDLKAAPITGLYAKERTGYPVYLTNSGDKDITVTINVGLLKTERLTTAEAGNNVKGNKNIPGWYEFTAPKTADYVFKMTLADNAQNLNTMIYTALDGTTRSPIYGAGERTISLEEDQTIYLRVSTNYSTMSDAGKELTPDVAGNIKISEFVYTDILKAGDAGTNVDFTKANTDARRCVFVAEEDGLYTFTWAAREAGKPFSVSVSGDISTSGEVKYLVKGQRVKFSMSPIGTPEENAPYAGCIKVTKRDSVAGNLQVGSTASVTLANDSYVWYAFTATKDNMYEISFAPKDGGSAAVIDTVEFYSEEKSDQFVRLSGNFTQLHALNKDRKIYFRLRASGATADNKAEYVFKVTERTEAGILEDGKTSSIIATSITGYVDGNWYKFVPTVGGHNYTIKIESDNEDTTVVLQRYSSIQTQNYSTTYSSNYGTREMYLYGADDDEDGVADNAYYFRAFSNQATETTSVTGKVTIQLVPEIN